jgi:hypothetical protein
MKNLPRVVFLSIFIPLLQAPALANSGKLTTTFTPPIAISKVGIGTSELKTPTINTKGADSLTATAARDDSAAPSKSKTVMLQLRSSSTEEVSDTFAITREDPKRPSSGTAAKLAVSPRSVNFPKTQLGQRATRQLTIRNTGLGVLEGNTAQTAVPFTVTSGGGPFSLSSGATHIITLEFEPITPAKVTGMLLISSNDPRHPIVTVQLKAKGFGQGVPEIVVSPLSLSFGSAPIGRESTSRELIVSNNGNSPLRILAITIEGSDRDHFFKTSDECSNGTLGANQSCTVLVSFVPISAGSKNAILSIPSTDSDESLISVALQGIPGDLLGRFRISNRGLYPATFDRRGAQAGYFPGQLIREFNNFDSVVSQTVAEEIGLQLEKMREMGVNTVTIELRSADDTCLDCPTAFVFPTCLIHRGTGLLWPQPTVVELTNLSSLFDLLHRKGMRGWLRLVNTHMDEQPPINNQLWLESILTVVKDHPAFDLVLFEGNKRLVDTDGNGIVDACGIPAEPPLWLGPTSIPAQYVKWAIGFARSLGIPTRKLSAEAIIGVFNFETEGFAGPDATDGHLWRPISVLKTIFDQLGIPESERTYAVSIYQGNKCAVPSNRVPCVDTDPHSWADENFKTVLSIVDNANGGRVVAAEMGAMHPTTLSWPAERALESLVFLLENYGIDGGTYWHWVSQDSAEDANPDFADAVKRRGVEFIYNPVQKEVVDMGGFHLTAIPNGSFETGGAMPLSWTASGNGSASRHPLAGEPGQPEVPSRGSHVLRLITGSDLNSTITARSEKIAITADTSFTTVANLRFTWSGDPSASSDPAIRPQVFVIFRYFNAAGSPSAVRAQDIFRLHQENSTNGFDTFPFLYVTPGDANSLQIEIGAARNGLTLPITMDVDNLR